MTWWSRAPGGATLGVSAWLLFAACGGQSQGDEGGLGAAGGGAGSAGCVYKGVHYDLGEVFGDCENCWCTDQGAACQARPCEGRAGSAGSGGAGGDSGGGSGRGSGGSGGASAGAGGLETGGTSGGTGSDAGQSGGGAAGEGGATSAGAGGEGGATQCEIAEIGRFCVSGIPIDSGEAFMEGMPFRVAFYPAGCHSSSCTRVVESSCNYLGSDGKFAISAFVCLASTGDDGCTADCGGGSSQCEPGIELVAGDYEISLAPSTEVIRFSVPSVVTSGGLCWSADENQAP